MSEMKRGDLALMMAEFEECDWFGLDELAERLTASTPAEAFEQFIDGACGGEDIAETIARNSKDGAFKLHAYRNDVVPDSWIKRRCSDIVERLGEDFSEEFGDPDGDTDVGGQRDADVEAMLLPVITEIIGKAKVWCTTKVGYRLYSVAEVEELLRKQRPEWFIQANCTNDVLPGDTRHHPMHGTFVVEEMRGSAFAKINCEDGSSTECELSFLRKHCALISRAQEGGA